MGLAACSPWLRRSLGPTFNTFWLFIHKTQGCPTRSCSDAEGQILVASLCVTRSRNCLAWLSSSGWPLPFVYVISFILIGSSMSFFFSFLSSFLPGAMYVEHMRPHYCTCYTAKMKLLTGCLGIPLHIYLYKQSGVENLTKYSYPDTHGILFRSTAFNNSVLWCYHKEDIITYAYYHLYWQ